MPITIPPPHVTCKSGHKLRGPDAIEGARQTYRLYNVSPDATEHLSRLALLFQEEFSEEWVQELYTERLLSDLTGNDFLQSHVIRLDASALSISGIVAVNMVKASYSDGNFDAELTEPFTDISVLASMSDDTNELESEGDRFSVTYTTKQLYLPNQTQ